jgi:hypothetical protein
VGGKGRGEEESGRVGLGEGVRGERVGKRKRAARGERGTVQVAERERESWCVSETLNLIFIRARDKRSASENVGIIRPASVTASVNRFCETVNCDRLG